MIKYLSLLILAFVVLGSALPVFAKGLVPCGGSGEEECKLYHLFLMLENFYDQAMIYATVIGVIIVVGAGITMITAMGNQSKVENAKKTLTAAVVGILIIWTSWLIINTILGILKWEPETGKWWEIGF
jgi:hypothetical protein